MERAPGFRDTLLEEGVQYLLGGDVEVGKSVLRDHINATVGLKELGGMTGKSPKSLMRMLGRQGDTQARNLFEIIGCLQERGSAIQVHAVRRGAAWSRGDASRASQQRGRRSLAVGVVRANVNVAARAPIISARSDRDRSGVCPSRKPAVLRLRPPPEHGHRASRCLQSAPHVPVQELETSMATRWDADEWSERAVRALVPLGKL